MMNDESRDSSFIIHHSSFIINVRMEKAYYTEYYRLEREHWWFRARNEMIINHLRQIMPQNRPLKILNIGAATGRSSEMLSALGTVESLEYDTDCCEFARRELKMEVVQGSILELPYPNEMFDIVCAFDVIEHVADDKKSVAEMRRVCKTGGIICIAVPAFMFLWSEHDVVNHHYRRYTGAQVLDLFDNTNKKIYHTYFNTGLFLPIAFFRLFSRLLPKRKAQGEETASDFGVLKNGFVSQFLYRFFKLENYFLQKQWYLPVGVSILSSWRKV
jgi:SAM-dependent methyltransferase